MRTVLAALVGTFVLIFAVGANAATNEDLRAELITMVQEDQKARQKLINAGMQDQELIRKVMEIDSRNTERLQEIIDRHGWPTTSMVGEDGTAYAFLIVQHADRNPAFQKHSLELMQEVAANNPSEVYLSGVALLTDRVRLAQGQKQLYGTQVGINPQTKKLVLFPVENPDKLGERRVAYGLPPMEEYLKQLRDLYKLPKN